MIESPGAGTIAFAPEVRPEMTRRNASMNIADTGARLASDEWPEAARASLRHERRVYLPRDERTILFFETERERRPASRRGGY